MKELVPTQQMLKNYCKMKVEGVEKLHTVLISSSITWGHLMGQGQIFIAFIQKEGSAGFIIYLLDSLSYFLPNNIFIHRSFFLCNLCSYMYKYV